MEQAYVKRDDAQLVRDAQGGDTRAYDELVLRYEGKVYRLAYKIVRHDEDAGDVLQEAFLSAFRALGKFKAESTFSTWLYRITTNAALMRLRKRRDNEVSLEQSQAGDRLGDPLPIPDWHKQPLEELLDGETREVLEDAIARLPEDLRIVFELRDRAGHSNQEVADMLDLTVAAVKSRLHRARLQLRDRLNRYFHDRKARRSKAPSPAQR